MSIWGQGSSMPLHAWACPLSLSSAQIPPLEQGRDFIRKHLSKRKMLREKAQDWKLGKRLSHCEVIVDWKRSLTLKWGVWGEQTQDLLWKKMRLRWVARSSRQIGSSEQSLYWNTCDMITMSHSLQREDSKLSGWISTREWKNVTCIRLFFLQNQKLYTE